MSNSSHIEETIRMMAAAPDLLSALEDLLYLTELLAEDRLDDYDAPKIARAAIRKAKGEK